MQASLLYYNATSPHRYFVPLFLVHPQRRWRAFLRYDMDVHKLHKGKDCPNTNTLTHLKINQCPLYSLMYSYFPPTSNRRRCPALRAARINALRAVQNTVN